VSGLISAVRRAGGTLLPSSLTVQDFYREFARAFHDNVEQAIQASIRAPDTVLDLIRKRKVSWSMTPVQMPIMIFFTIAGIGFAMPLSTFFAIMFVSMTVMFTFLENESKRRYGPKLEAEPAN
jgi:hypothetical protein